MPKATTIKEQDDKFLISIEYDKPIEAKVLADYLASLNDELKFFLKENKYDERYEDKLYIKKVKEGSIVIEPDLLVKAGASVAFLASQFPPQVLFDYGKQIVEVLKLCTKKEPDEKVKNMSNSRINSYKNFNLLSNNTKHITFNLINKTENKIEKVEQPRDENIELIAVNLDKISKEKNKEKEEIPVGETITAANFYWDNAKFTTSDTYAFRGIVEQLSKKAFPVTIPDANNKKFMTQEMHSGKAWHEVVYVADLVPFALKGSFAYKITKVYEDEVFYVEE